MLLKCPEEIAIISANCLLSNNAIANVIPFIAEGVTTLYLDRLIEEYIRDNAAVPSFKGYDKYPFATCMSVNDAVVHGFPNEEPLREGDIITIDVGSFANGFHSDTAYTVMLGEGDLAKRQLLTRTKQALGLGIEQAKIGNRVGDIGATIETFMAGYGVVRDLVGHGLGRSLHERPEVPNYGKFGKGDKLKKGLVIAVEPMITLGGYEVYVDKDGWTIRTKDGTPSAHYEQVVEVGEPGGIRLSDFASIERAIVRNGNLWNEQL